MPVESRYSEMDFDVKPRNKLQSIGRMGSGDSGFGSRSRNSNLDDDFMNYMSHEEKECILFFDTTLDSLNDDFEEGCSVCSVKSEDPATPTQTTLGTDEIIDLVMTRSQTTECVPKYDNIPPVDKDDGMFQKEVSQTKQEKAQLGELPTPHTAQVKKQRSFERTLPELEIESARASLSQTKPPGSVPTPMVIAQKIAEKKVGNGVTSPLSPKESKWFASENDQTDSISPTESHEFQYRNVKLQRFPSNISISMANKEYNNTITKAAVKVQERKAQVLANLGGTSLLAVESDDRLQKNKLNGPKQSLSFKEVVANPPRGEALNKLEQVKESNETALDNPSGFKPKIRNSASSQSMKAQPVSNGAPTTNSVAPPVKAPISKPETKEMPHHGPLITTSEIHRSRSIQKPSGFRPQGITVQFSGRGATDESRKEALRKLGLLRSNDIQ
ncbi:proline and serine-rich protein 2-like [Stegostoma tigrinum]|uniref:proline and serine-rich protein 2-like n=1 Tax=Stegostoma tigrinum TaxID=3053191 RepID=UPI00202B82C8|nr:proline and serine-rich protein 2-like [Stegostoma tigrinum]XP_048410531.1 proline and serine-rich protein 2-like [Stegostoma tigrinum]XP_059510816.1 proline and serine-rich protein 2-like [Stegostoma tigrinum]